MKPAPEGKGQGRPSQDAGGKDEAEHQDEEDGTAQELGLTAEARVMTYDGRGCAPSPPPPRPLNALGFRAGLAPGLLVSLTRFAHEDVRFLLRRMAELCCISNLGGTT